MKQNYSIRQFDRFKRDLLEITNPSELARLVDYKLHHLIKITQKPYYKSFCTSHKSKKRIVVEPGYELKIIQRKLNCYLQAVYFFSKPDCVHGFVRCPSDVNKKLSILSNAASHVKKDYVINADVFRFFPSITGDMVKNVFTQSPFNFDDNLASAITLLCINKNWLPTGAPTSPTISNFVCMNIDIEFKKLANDYGYTYTRYADDLSFSGRNKPDLYFKEKLTQILNRNGFKLNYKKYRVLSKHTRQTVTGLVVNEKLNVNRNYKRKLRASQHNMRINQNQPSESKNEVENMIASLKSEILNNSISAKHNFIEMVKNYH